MFYSTLSYKRIGSVIVGHNPKYRWQDLDSSTMDITNDSWSRCLTSSNCLTASAVTHTVAKALKESAFMEFLLLSMIAVNSALGTPQSTKGRSVILFMTLVHFSWRDDSVASLNIAKWPIEVSVLLRIISEGGSSIIDTSVWKKHLSLVWVSLWVRSETFFGTEKLI